MPTIVNDVTTVAELRVGATALIITTHREESQAQACTVEAVYQDSPGWIVEFRYTAGNEGAVLHGSKYFHNGYDLVDVITVQDGEA